MKNRLSLRSRCQLFRAFIIATASFLDQPASAQNAKISIPFSEIGAKAAADYQGDAIRVTPTREGALLRCGFQKLEGRATGGGLWLISTEEGSGFGVMAAATGREEGTSTRLAARGEVSVAGEVVSFARPGLLEQYSASMDGVRQDFVVAQRPEGTGRLCVELAVRGARVEAAAYGAKLTLHGAGREVAYSRLLVTDAAGRELLAVMEAATADTLKVRVDDAGAVYPVRIDPTFSDADWVVLNAGGGTGPNFTVFSAVADGGGNLYIGGSFTFIGSIPINTIAKWNGSTWSPLGAGTNGFVTALAVSGTDLYAAGGFTTAGGVPASNIARWDGSAWSALGSGLGSAASALAVSGTDLYVGGSFSTAGGVSVSNIAKWNGSAWSALGSGTSSNVFALKVVGSDLYAGGQFTTAGGGPATRVAKWNGTAWSALGGGASGPVYSLASIGTDIYAGGSFLTADGVSVNNVAKWNGSAWSALGAGISGEVRTLAATGSTLYAGGSFTSAGSVAADNVARWNGSAWSALGSGTSSVSGQAVHALAVSGSTVFAGGVFVTAGGVTVNRLGQWNGSAWSAVGPGTGMESTVRAVLVSGTNLYAGGSFTKASGVTVNRVAKWNGSAWSALGTGMNGDVHALAMLGTDLYAGGDFTTAGGATANRVAKWNGSAWSPLTASGINGSVFALAFSGTDLYAGGTFGTAGGASAINIAKWSTTGSSWSALGTGTDGVIRALAVSGPDVYAAGNFVTAGGVTVNRVARWNGTVWSALATGVSTSGHSVNALAVSGPDLYIGGTFSVVSGVSANRVARWNGSAWSALGSGVGDIVYSLVARGTEVFVGGQFTTAGGAPARRIAKWSGSVWSPLGSGMDNIVRALALDIDSHLYVGGDFTVAGVTVSPFIAQANLPKPAIVVEQPVSTVIADGGAVSYGNYFSGNSSLVFTIRNTGNDDLGGLSITKDGANAAEFVVTANPVSPVVPAGTTTFTIQFAPTTSGTTKNAAIHIANNADPTGDNPYDIFLSGQAYLHALDTDSDGMNDGAEFQMSALGFNWQSSQAALVSTYYASANGAGLYTTSQVQALNAPAPLIQRHPTTGVFTLTLGVEKSTTLAPGSFLPFPMSAPQTTINGAGKLEFQFTVPDNVAFFRLGAQ